MKKVLLVSLVATLALVGAIIVIPVFAQGPNDGNNSSPNQNAWDKMHQACVTGDWDKMAEAAKEFHGNGVGLMMPQNNSTCYSSEANGFMGSGMMGGGRGGGGSMMGSNWSGMMDGW